MMPKVEFDLSNLPKEIQDYPQWCFAGADKSPNIMVGDQLVNVSLHDTDKLMDFNKACELSKKYKLKIGFILNKDDPFTCIDIDIKDSLSKDRLGNLLPESHWTTKETIERYYSILAEFRSYTEISSNGKGLHIWAVGEIGKGRRRDGIEIYSQERFIICTGATIDYCEYDWDNILSVWNLNNVSKGKFPLEPKQNILDNMVKQLEEISPSIELIEIEPVKSDDEIIQIGCTASNSEKFMALCRGEWKQLGYESQSEADFSLLSMLTFYTQSNEQVRRIFRMTELGKREKATKNNYFIDRSLSSIRAREERERAMTERLMQTSTLVRQMEEESIKKDSESREKPPSSSLPEITDKGLSWPPGMVGALASFIYKASVRPVREVSIVTALGLMAGIVGKSYNIPNSGLNLYITLVAKSGIGKEAMHSGTSLIMEKLRSAVPMAQNFVSFTNYASGPALIKACSKNPSMVNINGEWGRKLKRIAAEDGREGPMQSLRSEMTNLYQKSAAGSIVGGLGYSNEAENIASISGVAYSMIGETTPNTFFESLTESMMEDGFLSRFNIIEYRGKRPPQNMNIITEMDPNLLETLINICVQSLNLINTFSYEQVGTDAESALIMEKFDKRCDYEINNNDNESWRQMWNRAHLKALRLAAILAVCDNHLKPVIRKTHCDWALEVINRDINLMGEKLEGGDVGSGDVAREKKLLSIIRDYSTNVQKEGYKINETMRQTGIIPRSFLSMRINRVSSFISHRGGANLALNQSLNNLVDNGYLVESDKNKVFELYGFQGKCYNIVKIPSSLIKNT